MDWMKHATQSVKKFQQGGTPEEMAAAEQGAPAGPEGGAPQEGGGDIMAAMQQAVQAGDPALAQQVLQAIAQDPNASLEFLTMIVGGGQEAAPAEGGAPMARNGMQMGRRTGGPVFDI